MKTIGVILTLVVLIGLVAAGFFLFTGGMAGNFFRGKIGSPLTVYGNDKTSYSDKLIVGSDLNAINLSGETGWTPKYTSVQAGQWMNHNEYGYQTLNQWLDDVYSHDSTPVVLWYYWGNDTTPENIQNGIGTKSVDEWYNMTDVIADSVNTATGSKGGIIVVEPQFNKGGVDTWSDFNSYLMNVTDRIHAKCTKCKVAIGFGNWNNGNWSVFSDAVNHADMVGYDGVVRYPDQTETQYKDVVENSIAASQYMQKIFPGKPIIWYDFGASSYPEPANYYLQQDAMKSFFDNMGRLKDAGTNIVMYKNFKDVTEFVGPEDQHWGVIDASGQHKPAYNTFISGVTGTYTTQTSSTTNDNATV